MSFDNSPNPFGPYAHEVSTLQRAVSYLQEQKSKAESNGSTQNVTGITAHTTPLDEVQRQSILWAVNDAIAKLEYSFGPSASLVPGRKRNEIVNGQVNLPRHRRFCAVCRHPDREAIEQAFLQWGRVGNIVGEFELPNRRCLYRHARAFNLFEQRSQNLRAALEYIIEEAEEAKPTADSIIRAIKAYSCLDDHGRWSDLPQRIVVTRVDQSANATLSADPELPVAPARIQVADAIPVEGREVETPPASEPPAKS
jgi:hypothetical protein